MNIYERRSISDGQILFNRILYSFLIVIKTLVRVIVYSPLLFLGYLITTQILTAQTNKVFWLALIIMFAVILYAVIYFFKGVLIAVKFNRKFTWMFLFLCLTVITCILPVWIVFNPLQNFVAAYINSNQQLITWLIALAFVVYVYSRYHFLTNIAPNIAFPYYQMGINSTIHLLNLSNTFKAKRSEDFI